MKKIIHYLSPAIFFLLYVSGARFVYAQNAPTNELCPEGWTALCNIRFADNAVIVGKIITVLLIMAAVVCIIFLIWGGIKWIKSEGDKGKVAEARSTIIGAIIGLIIAFLAYFIVGFIFQMITGEPMGQFILPTLVP